MPVEMRTRRTRCAHVLTIAFTGEVIVFFFCSDFHIILYENRRRLSFAEILFGLLTFAWANQAPSPTGELSWPANEMSRLIGAQRAARAIITFGSPAYGKNLRRSAAANGARSRVCHVSSGRWPNHREITRSILFC